MSSPRSKPLSFSSIKVGPLPATPANAEARPDAQRTAAAGEISAALRNAPPVSAEQAPTATPAPAPVAPSPARQPVALEAPPAAPGGIPTRSPSSVLLTRIAEPPPRARGVYIVAALASLLWAGGLVAFEFGYATHAGPVAVDPVTLAILAVMMLGPVGFVWAAAYAVVQARNLAMEARRSARLTDELVGPMALAASQAGEVVEAMRLQIATASEVANQAREQLVGLKEALSQQTQQLAEATAGASRTAINLVETLSRERGELNTLAVTLDARSAAVTDAINRQARMVAEASDLAETQLREAEATLAARAADLAAAAGEAVDASRVATEDLGRQIGRLETAGVGVGDQMRALEDGLTQQRAALVTVAHALRAEQEDFATLVESRTAQLSDVVATANADVTALNEATTRGAQSLSHLIAEARDRFRELAEAATEERDSFARAAEDTLKGLAEAGAREREHLEAAMRSTITALSAAAVEAREAADVHAEAARARVDLLNEAAFTAGQTADQVFEARLTEARGLIEQSARLVEEAGDRTANRLGEQIAASREALDGLNQKLEEVVARAARLPEETGAQARGIAEAMEKGLADLMASAHRAAEETQAIDAAFQERVKRNYEMLSEAVQLMGVVAAGGQGASVLQRPTPAERVRSRIAATTAPPLVEAPAPEADAGGEGAPTSELPLRGRLRLTPTASDDEFKMAFDAANGGPAAAEENGWTWKQLLTSLDDGTAGDEARLGEALFAEIEGMGIDPAALLPRGRIDEIAAAVQAGDGAGAREVVRTLAPAAIRRLARRLMADTTFRTRCQLLVRRYAEAVAEATRRDRQGFQAAALLGSNTGRAYLLLDAAASQIS